MEKQENLVPPILYKYRDFNKFAFNIFINKQIYFARPDEFNDPFDCGIPIRYDKLTPEQHDELNTHILINRFNVPVDQAKATLEIYKKNGKVRSDVAGMSEWQLKNLHDHIRIFCLSRESDNLLLWSHYANYHKGFCIGFDTERLCHSTKAALGQVVYEDEFPFISPLPYTTHNHRIQSLIKSTGWNYENEYRLITLTSKQVFPIDPLAIQQVVFGCKASETDQSKLIEIIQGEKTLSHITFFKAEKIPYHFKLSVEPILSK